MHFSKQILYDYFIMIICVCLVVRNSYKKYRYKLWLILFRLLNYFYIDNKSHQVQLS